MTGWMMQSMACSVLALLLAVPSVALAVGTVEASDPEAGQQVRPAPTPCDGELHTDADGNVVSCDPVSTEFLRLDTPDLPPPSKDLDKALRKAARKAAKAAKRDRAKKSREEPADDEPETPAE